MRLIVAICLALLIVKVNSYATDVSFIDDTDDSEKSSIAQAGDSNIQGNSQKEGLAYLNQVEADNQEYDEMDSFLKTEDQMSKEIVLLNLNVEKTNLELKKREMEQKIFEINKLQGGLQRDTSKPAVKLMGIIVNSVQKQAIVNINNQVFKLNQGQMILGVLIKQITYDGVMVEFEDGSKQELII